MADSLQLNLLPLVRSWWDGLRLRHEAGPGSPLRSRGLVAVVPYYGNQRLLEHFLDHHRRLGVDEFVFLDLSQDAQLAVLLAEEHDCAIWRPTGRPDPKKAIYWLNDLRRRYASDRWCLSLEPNELFVFRNYELRKIEDLTDFLEAERRNHMFALIVEMYGEEPAAAFDQASFNDPLQLLPYFDALGYATSGPHRYRNVIVRGGVQRRTLYWDAPRRSPALNRIPLVKWRWYFVYIAGTRLMMPCRMNTAHSPWHSSPTACLLDFSLLDAEESLARAATAEEGYLVSAGAGAYSGAAALRHQLLKQDLSERFTGSASLVECGLLNPGQWF